jgi:hypothetical protein
MKMIERTILFNLPLSIKGFCFCTPEGEKICVLNSRFTFEANKKTLLHEQGHIANNDFDCCYCVDEIELVRSR